MRPFFSIVTVARNDAWALTKTARSVFRQQFKDFEYLMIDGASTDGSTGLIEFWRSQGLVHHAVSEPDTGVYSAMNKGLRQARGRFVCFLNAGDVFAGDDILARVHALLADDALDGALGWGELNGQIWCSWVESPAFTLASLGFCHQSLFVRRELLQDNAFDERPFKTDSDTQQLGQLFASGARIPVVPEVWAIRGGEPGISANLERTRVSIVETLQRRYELDTDTAEQILAFRRRCAEPEALLALLARAPSPLREHLALMVCDTLFLRQSVALEPPVAEALLDRAREVLEAADPAFGAEAMDRLIAVQERRLAWLGDRRHAATRLKAEIAKFEHEEARRLDALRAERQGLPRAAADYVVSLTSFPARIPTLHLVIQSLVEQTSPPREIHLWLGSDEIPARHWLPKALLAFEAHGLHVHLVKRTFHQYDKFMHADGLGRDVPFVIVDDDVIYPPGAMQALLDEHARHPQAVVANRCHRMGILADGTLQPYQDWPREIRVERPSLRAFPTGAGGVLYPAGFVTDPGLLDAREVLAHAPYADDIWLKFNALARGIPTMSTPLSEGARWYLRYTPTMREGALHATNVDLGLNDRQLERCAQWLDRQRPGWRDELRRDGA